MQEPFQLVRRPNESDVSFERRLSTLEALKGYQERQASKAPDPFSFKAPILSDDPVLASMRPNAEPKKKKANHNKRSRAFWELQGYRYSRVETYDARFKRSKDLLGAFDSLILGKGETIGCQECSKASISARKSKMKKEPKVKDWLDSGNRAVILAWSKPGARWVPTLIELTKEDFKK